MKRTLLSLFALSAASLLAGCHCESITGPPMGANALTGQIVTTGDLAGASPAGISVMCSAPSQQHRDPAASSPRCSETAHAADSTIPSPSTTKRTSSSVW